MTKKHVWQTILLTIGVVLILAVSAFGVASLTVPAAMMDLTASMGLTSISGDYAYQEYERSGDVGCLARSFIISATDKNYKMAEKRRAVLYADEGFESFLAEQGDIVVTDNKGEEVGRVAYADYCNGLAATVRYHTADEESMSEVITFAVEKTAQEFPRQNPALMLSVEVARAGDKTTGSALLSAMEGANFDRENQDYQNIIHILEDVINE